MATHPLQELLQLVGLLIPQFVSELLGLQLFLLMFLLRLRNGSANKDRKKRLSSPPIVVHTVAVNFDMNQDLFSDKLQRDMRVGVCLTFYETVRTVSRACGFHGQGV